MAGRKGSRSSKTDHVLNLLSGGVKKEEAPAAPEQEKAGSEASVSIEKPREEQISVPGERSEPTEGDLTRRGGGRLGPPILQVARTNNEALSSTIREALTRTLEEEEARRGGESRNAEPEPEQGAEAVTEMETETVPGPEAVPVMEEMTVPQSEQPEHDRAEKEKENQEPAEPFLPRETRLPDSAVCVNVMELLVNEWLDRYVQMFGLCTCPRCLADVRALALTRLPPKYVVIPGTYATPMISLYRAKFESQVIAQVIQACKTVMENPRHTQ